MTPLIACVTGPDGSGKSTQVGALAERLRGAGRSVAVSNIWDPMLDPAVAERALFKRPVDADEYLELLEPVARMYFLCHALRESLVLGLARNADVLLLNAYWYKYYATEVAHGGEPAILRAIAGVLPEPDVTFYLSVSVAEMGRRKQSFTGYETGFAGVRSTAAFEAFQRPALEELEGLAAERSWIMLSGDAPAAQLTDRLFGDIAKLAAGRGPRAMDASFA